MRELVLQANTIRQAKNALMETFNADSGNPAFALLQGKAHPLALVQLAQPGMLNGADMHENIASASIRSNKPISFSGVEPFDNPGQRGAFRAVLVFLHRFHVDTFLGPSVRAFSLSAG
jgi:hypothetical protein